MPGPTDVDHEHQAIEGLCDVLTGRGLPSQVLAWPDTDPDHPLNVDAIADVAGTSVVIEHCRLTVSNTVPAGVDEARQALDEPLRRIAEAAGHAITLAVAPPNGGRPKDRTAWYHDVLDLARSSAAQGPGTYHGTDHLTTTVDVLDGPTLGGEPSMLSFWVGDAAASVSILSEQVVAAMHDAWEKKLSKQLPPAKAAGHLVALLVDQMPSPGQAVPSQFLATTHTVAQAIGPLLDAHPGIVDWVWLRLRNGTYEPVNLPSTS